MSKFLLSIAFVFCILSIYAENPVFNSQLALKDTIHLSDETDQSISTYSLYLNHQQDPFGKKIIRGFKYSFSYNFTMGLYLVLAPEHISKWGKEEKFNLNHIKNQYKDAYTKPPVIDHDMWVINYIGHPYQGGFYYNTLRSQGANFWQSSMFCIGQSLLWEYGWEAGMEQPSIQDLITTPFLGIVVGEISHIATKKFSKNGFKWYEIGLVCILNPAYAINNGFRFNKH